MSLAQDDVVSTDGNLCFRLGVCQRCGHYTIGYGAVGFPDRPYMGHRSEWST